MVDILGRAVDAYVNHVVRQVNKRAAAVRGLQASSGRTQERIVRYEVYQGDVRRRDLAQPVYTFTVRVRRDGAMERLDGAVRPDVTVYTDVPTVVGLSRGRTNQILPDGTARVIQPFTVYDALRLDRIEWSGTSQTLQDLLLFERKVAPEFLRALELPQTTA